MKEFPGIAVFIAPLVLFACGQGGTSETVSNEAAASVKEVEAASARSSLEGLPAWYPKAFPLPKGTEIANVLDEEDDGSGRVFIAFKNEKMTARDVFEFYPETLSKAGFKDIETEEANGDFSIDASFEGDKLGGYTKVGMLISPLLGQADKANITVNFDRD